MRLSLFVVIDTIRCDRAVQYDAVLFVATYYSWHSDTMLRSLYATRAVESTPGHRGEPQYSPMTAVVSWRRTDYSAKRLKPQTELLATAAGAAAQQLVRRPTV